MNVVTIHHRPPQLHRPVLVAAFKGWNDAGEAATGAASVLARTLEADPFADVDPEEFFDFQATRPTVRLGEGGLREVDWPANRFAWAELPGTDRHLVILEGTEPHLRWRTFSDGIARIAGELGVELVVTLGALQVDVPHSRPVPVTGSTSDPSLAARLGVARSLYEGPTGITGVLHAACAAAGHESVSFWAGVPHYLAGTPYLTGALALTERLVEMLGADVPLQELARDAASQREDIAELVAEDEELAEYVTELERRDDLEPSVDPGLPVTPVSGDELAAEFERYLRDRGDG